MITILFIIRFAQSALMTLTPFGKRNWLNLICLGLKSESQRCVWMSGVGKLFHLAKYMLQRGVGQTSGQIHVAPC